MSARLAPVGLLLLLAWSAAVPGDWLPDPDLSVLDADVRQVLQDARDDLERQLANDSAPAVRRASALATLGRLYQAHLLTDAAIVCYARAVDLAPDDYRWHYHLAHARESNGQLPAAVAAYGRALALAPESGLVRLRLGQVLLQSGELDAAAARLRAAARDPDLRAAALYELGKLAFSQQDYAAARTDLEQALALQPGADRIHYTLALVYRAQDELERARRHMELRGSNAPRFPDPLTDPLRGLSTGQRMLFRLGMNAANDRDYVAAARWFGQGLDGAPDNQAARISLGRFRFLAGDTAGAEQALSAVPRDADGAALAGLLLGALRQAAGDLDGATIRYRAALALQPGHAGLHYYLANALYRADDFAAAARHYRQSLQLADGNAGAAFWGILAEIRSGAPLSSVKTRLEAARQRHPDNPAIGYFLAALLAAAPDAALRDGERALRLAEALRQRRPSPEHAGLLAMALAETGDFEQAVQVQEQALSQARAGWRWDLIDRLQENLERYRAQRPCRTPWTPEALAWQQPPFDAARLFEHYPADSAY